MHRGGLLGTGRCSARGACEARRGKGGRTNGDKVWRGQGRGLEGNKNG